MDMDLDELDCVSHAPSGHSRFAPKNSRFKPKPKAKPPKLELNSSSILPTAKEDSAVPLIVASDSGEIANVEMQSLCTYASNRDNIVKMDTDLKTEDNQTKGDLMKEGNHKDEDPVVRDIDVFFTPSVGPNTLLYVMQYPLKPIWRPYELDGQCEEVRVKPASSEVAIDLLVPDSESGERMTKQVLSSSWVPYRSGYAIGLLIGNKLYLNPVHAAAQFRASMQHFVSEELGTKNILSHDGGVLAEEKSCGASNQEWIHLKYHSSNSNASDKYLHKMVAEEGSEIEFAMSSSDYIDSLCPGPTDRPGGPSRRYLLSLPLEDRLKMYLCKVAPVHRFDVLKYLAPSDSVADLLEVLKKLCYLVQGLWVPKSSLLKLQGLEALARDYTLYLFSKSHCISKNDLPLKSKFKKAMEDVLKVFSIHRPAFSDWKFKEPTDMSFVQLYPDIVEEQELAWETRGEKLNAQISGERSAHGINNPSKIDAKKGVPKNSWKTPAKKSISDETREALIKALQKLFQSNKVCSFQRICKLLRDMAISKDVHAKGGALEKSAAIGLDAPPEELLAIINQVAVDIHGVYVSKTSTEHSYDGLRRTVIDLLIAEGPNAKLKKAAILEAAKIRLKREGIPVAEYSKVMSELCVSRNSVWVLKSGDGSPDDKPS